MAHMEQLPSEPAPAADMLTAVAADWPLDGGTDDVLGIEVTYLDVEEVEPATVPAWNPM